MISLAYKAINLEKLKASKSVESQFNSNLLKLLKIVNEYKEHIPSITTTEGNPFPYQVITVAALLLFYVLTNKLDCNTILGRKLEFYDKTYAGD